MQAGRGDDDAGSVASGHTASGSRRSGRRVTFSPSDKDDKEPKEDNFLQVCTLNRVYSTHNHLRLTRIWPCVFVTIRGWPKQPARDVGQSLLRASPLLAPRWSTRWHR